MWEGLAARRADTVAHAASRDALSRGLHRAWHNKSDSNTGRERHPSGLGKRATLTSMGWGLAVLYVGQQTFDGVPDIELPLVFDRIVPTQADSLPRARAGIMVSPTLAELESGAVTCSRTLLT